MQSCLRLRFSVRCCCARFWTPEFLRWLRLLIFLAVAAALVSGWGNGTDFLKKFLVSCVLLGFAVFGIRWVARFNLLGWFLVVACVGLIGGSAQLLTQPNAFYRTEGYIVVAAIIALLGWPLLAWRLSGSKAVSAPTAAEK